MKRKMKHKIFYLNALFDLELGGYPVENVKRSASEMEVLFLPMCDSQDILLLDFDIPEDYLAYLAGYGLKIPEIKKNVYHRDIAYNGFEPVVWGWNENAVNNLAKFKVCCTHPDLDIVKKINNRKYCNELGISLNLGVKGSLFVGSADDYLELTHRKDLAFPLVLKPAFGGSGYGMSVAESSKELVDIMDDGSFYIHHGGLIIESWCNRLYDLSTNLCIESDGTISMMRHQRLIANSFGAFVGIYMAPFDPLLNRWKGQLEEAAVAVANQMYKDGFIGAAGFDSFVYNDSNEKETVAPIIEINGRYVMSYVAHALRDQIAPDKYCLFRMISRKRMKLPDTYEKWNELFNSKTKNIMLATPLRIRHEKEWVQPARTALFLFADTEAELLELDSFFRV
jgi:hypothetical protein